MRSLRLIRRQATEDTSPKGDQVTIISSERRAEYYRREGSRIASRQWHSDITFEPVPYDHAILKVHTNPPSGGDTLWESAYEPYSRLSREFAHFLEGLEAYHEASFFNEAAKAYRVNLRTGQRGSPLNKGEHLSAVHPVIRRIIANNHDLQVRFKWSVNNASGIGDVAIWDNRSTFHSATYDHGNSLRTGDRVVSIGEKPYFDPSATTRRESLGLDAWH